MVVLSNTRFEFDLSIIGKRYWIRFQALPQDIEKFEFLLSGETADFVILRRRHLRLLLLGFRDVGTSIPRLL